MDINFSKYVGGQLEIKLMPIPTGIKNAATYRGEVDDIDLDGRQVRVELLWVAKTTVGRYTLDTQFDLDLDFEIRRVTENENGNLRVITEQGEEMTFFMAEDKTNIKRDDIIGFHTAPLPKKQEVIVQSFARGPMITDIRINYADGSYDVFSLLDGDKDVIGCYGVTGHHFENQSPDNVIPSKHIAQYLYKVSSQGKALNATVPPLEIAQVANKSIVVDAPIANNVKPASKEKPLCEAGTTANSKELRVLAFLAIWLLPLFGMLLVQGDGPPAGGGPVSIWGIWFLGVPLAAWMYRKYTSNQSR